MAIENPPANSPGGFFISAARWLASPAPFWSVGIGDETTPDHGSQCRGRQNKKLAHRRSPDLNSPAMLHQEI
jgi:hypothetical protein